MIRRRLAAAIAVLAFGPSLHAQTTISAPGGSSIGFFGGSPFTRTIGQTFTTPTDNRLDRFSFFLGGRPTTMNFRAYVLGFTVDFRGVVVATSSTPLWASEPLSVTTNGETLTRLDVFTGGVTLAAGQQYGVFISTLDVVNAATNGLSLSKGADTYSGGQYITFNGTTREWNSGFWQSAQGEDLQFELLFNRDADMGVVPEPSTYALMGTGIVGLLVLRRRRARSV